MTATTVTATQVKAGLEGVVAAETRISGVDGQAGELIIAGFPVEELARQATFEEVAYLLWHDALPNAAQIAEFRQALSAHRALSEITLNVLQAAAIKKTLPMDALRMAVSTLSLESGQANTSGIKGEAILLTAGFPTIIAAYWRLLNDKPLVAPRPDLQPAANYLYMLTGEEPTYEQSHALDTYLNTVVDHGLNASTFAARVIIATQSDLVSAIVGAVGALKRTSAWRRSRPGLRHGV